MEGKMFVVVFWVFKNVCRVDYNDIVLEKCIGVHTYAHTHTLTLGPMSQCLYVCESHLVNGTLWNYSNEIGKKWGKKIPENNER